MTAPPESAQAEILRSLQWGAYAEAERQCLAQLAGNADDAAVRGLLGLAYAQQGKLSEALEAFRELTRRQPLQPDHQINLGCVCLDLGDLPAGVGAFEAAVALAPDNVGALLNLGLARFRAGQHRPAAEALEAALFAQPSLSVAAVYRARCLLELDDKDEALRTLEAVRSAQGLDAAALNELGLAWLGLDEPHRARAALELAVRADPRLDEAWTTLAALAERDNRLEEAEACFARQSEAGRKQPMAGLVQARLLGRRGAVFEALRILAGIDRTVLDRRTASEIAFEQGQLLDRAGETDAAYQTLLEANDLARANRAKRSTATAASAQGAEWMRDHPELDAAIQTAQRQSPAPRTPVFLVGFPRSGTTLLDQALDAHPDCAVLEEKPAVEAMARALRQRARGYPASLADLNAADIDRLRALYWSEVEKHLRPGAQRLLIDKYPLNLAHLQLILRVFPGARFIFAIRHPCDVVLSCFMQNFRFTDSTQGFWTLKGSAEIYVRVMELWLAQRQRLQPACLDLRYEDLVQDFEAHLRRALQFLKLPWNEAVLRYAQHARGRSIRTPSYSQVVQPVYTHARGRWIKYRHHLSEVEAALAPLIRRLGYSDPPG